MNSETHTLFTFQFNNSGLSCEKNTGEPSPTIIPLTGFKVIEGKCLQIPYIFYAHETDKQSSLTLLQLPRFTIITLESRQNEVNFSRPKGYQSRPLLTTELTTYTGITFTHIKAENDENKRNPEVTYTFQIFEPRLVINPQTAKFAAGLFSLGNDLDRQTLQTLYAANFLLLETPIANLNSSTISVLLADKPSYHPLNQPLSSKIQPT